LPGLTVTQFTITSANGSGASHARTEIAEGTIIALKAAIGAKLTTSPTRAAAQSTNAPSRGCADIAIAGPATKAGSAQAIAADACRFTEAGTDTKVSIALCAAAHATLAACTRTTANTNPTTLGTAAHGALTALAGATTNADTAANASRSIASAALVASLAGAEIAKRAGWGTHVTEHAAIGSADVAGIAWTSSIAKGSIKTLLAAVVCGGRKPRCQAGRIAGHAESGIMCSRHRLGRGRSAGQALYATNGTKITRVRGANA
jgi:hypothetical protein